MEAAICGICDAVSSTVCLTLSRRSTQKSSFLKGTKSSGGSARLYDSGQLVGRGAARGSRAGLSGLQKDSFHASLPLYAGAGQVPLAALLAARNYWTGRPRGVTRCSRRNKDRLQAVHTAHRFSRVGGPRFVQTRGRRRLDEQTAT